MSPAHPLFQRLCEIAESGGLITELHVGRRRGKTGHEFRELAAISVRDRKGHTIAVRAIGDHDQALDEAAGSCLTALNR